MKAAKKLICLLCAASAVLMLFSGCGKGKGSGSSDRGGSADAAPPEPTVYTAHESEAIALRNLGFLKGGAWELGLDKTVSRMEGVILAIRLGGKEKTALAYEGECPFTDAPTWTGADRYLAYAASRGLTTGTDGTFRPDEPETVENFAKMALSELGYLSDDPVKKSIELNLLGSGADYYRSGAITKNDCVWFMYNALKSQTMGGTTLIEKMVGDGLISKGGAQKNGLIAAEPTPEYKRYDSVPILMYHVIKEFTGTYEELYLNPEHFQQHLDYFEAHGIHPVTLSDVYDNWYNNKPLPDKPIVLTFDDGYRSVYTEAFTRMVQKGYVGVFFLYTDYINVDDSCLSFDMVHDMVNNGMEIGSHTVSHCDLLAQNEEQLHHELGDSLTGLENITGTTIKFLAYPSGRNNDNVRRVAKEVGYLGAVTTVYGVASTSDDLFGLQRIRIDKGNDASALESKLPESYR